MLKKADDNDTMDKDDFPIDQNYVITPFMDPNAIKLLNNSMNMRDNNKEIEEISFLQCLVAVITK